MLRNVQSTEASKRTAEYLRGLRETLRFEAEAAGYDMAGVARALNRPYDSTRNYFVGEREIPTAFILEVLALIGMTLPRFIEIVETRLGPTEGR